MKNPNAIQNHCDELRASSGYVRRWLSRQPGVKEESITDWLLYDISERLPSVLYVPFSRHEEARTTGADWEWWIVFPQQSLRMRVQAKKVSTTKNNYPELARTNRYGMQIDKLLSDSKAANAVPLYALYHAGNDATMCKLRPPVTDDGVFMAGAKLLYSDFIAGGPKGVSASDLLSRSNPFSCFACCPLVREGARFLQEYYPTEAHREESANAPAGVHFELPAHVSSLLKQPTKAAPDWWEREFQSSIQDFNGLLVYDFRDGQRSPE